MTDTRQSAFTVGDFEITVEPRGPSEEEYARLREQVLHSAPVREIIGDGRHALLALTVDEASVPSKRLEITPLDQLSAVIYDYTTNQSVRVSGSLTNLDMLEVDVFGDQPLSTPEEFRLAIELLHTDDEIGPLLREQLVIPYPAMPPLIDRETPDGRIERTLAVGLLPQRDGGSTRDRRYQYASATGNSL